MTIILLIDHDVHWRSQPWKLVTDTILVFHLISFFIVLFSVYNHLIAGPNFLVVKYQYLIPVLQDTTTNHIYGYNIIFSSFSRLISLGIFYHDFFQLELIWYSVCTSWSCQGFWINLQDEYLKMLMCHSLPVPLLSWLGCIWPYLLQ